MLDQEFGTHVPTKEPREQIRYAKVCSTAERTKQEFVEECDINSIMRNWDSTGLIQHQSANPPTYGNFDQGINYQTALNAIIEADEQFGNLPSAIRTRMGNSPAKLLDFLQDPENREEAIKLGLIMPSASEPAGQDPPEADPPPDAPE